MKSLIILMVGIFLLLLAGCRADEAGPEPAAVVVEQYLLAIAAQDSERAIDATCDEMRAFVLDDVSDFADVMAQVDNVACQVIDSGDGVARVVCAGTSTLIGDPQVLEIPVIDRVYVVEQREGDWLICDMEARE